jgi:hypothetical protein
MKGTQSIVGLFIFLLIIISMGIQFPYSFENGIKMAESEMNQHLLQTMQTYRASRCPDLEYIGIANPSSTITVLNLFDGMPTYW